MQDTSNTKDKFAVFVDRCVFGVHATTMTVFDYEFVAEQYAKQMQLDGCNAMIVSELDAIEYLYRELVL